MMTVKKFRKMLKEFNPASRIEFIVELNSMNDTRFSELKLLKYLPLTSDEWECTTYINLTKRK